MNQALSVRTVRAPARMVTPGKGGSPASGHPFPFLSTKTVPLTPPLPRAWKGKVSNCPPASFHMTLPSACVVPETFPSAARVTWLEEWKPSRVLDSLRFKNGDSNGEDQPTESSRCPVCPRLLPRLRVVRWISLCRSSY